MSTDKDPRSPVRFDGTHCTIVIERPRSGVVVLRISGRDVGEFGTRMVGTGERARQIAALFRLCARKHGLDGGLPELDSSRFRPPLPRSGQLRLF